MSRVSCVLMLLGLLSITAGAGDAEAAVAHGQPATTRGGPPAPSTAATHSVRGLVKAISESSMVIARSSRQSEMTFLLNQSTARSERIAVGAEVSVRYRIDGRTLIAAAVFVHRLQH
jgi:hypothetical protein